MLPSFTLQLNNPILRGLAAVGKYDGEHASLTCATAAGKIFFHSPHERDSKSDVTFLNINRKISTLACGQLNRKLGRDLLLVGAQTTLLAYDVRDNSDLFFRDAPDGVNTVLVGCFVHHESPQALVGGNCSIQGFDHQGNEVFWTVAGDNVSAMAFCEAEEEGGMPDLLVGSDDYEIRVFRNEEVVSETTETDRIVALAPLRGRTFAYALANGTVGVYDKPGSRRWRVKSRHEVTAVCGFDLDGDGCPEVISGWANGKLEVRSDSTAEVVFKDNMGASISAILQSDYRSDGHMELLVCSADGEVRGYLPATGETAAGGLLMEGQLEEETLRELQQRKQEMLFELKQYEEHARKQRDGTRAAGLVAPDTRINAKLTPNKQDGCLHLALSSSNDTRIRAAVVFAERVFEGESFAVHEKEPTGELCVPLRPAKDVSAELTIKALVGGRAMPVCHVFELSMQLPRFAMYLPVDSPAARAPAAGVSFVVREPAAKVKAWILATFNVASVRQASDDTIEQGFVSLRDDRPIWIRMTPDAGGTVQLRTEDMEFAGDVLQDLCAALHITELESSAEFPQEMEAFRAVLLKVDEFNAVRVQLTAELADTSNLAKTLVVKAEDARILGDTKSMRSAYTQLYSLNGQLLGEYNKRANNHEQLLASLKEVNHMIQKAARLRVGGAKTRVVSACRAAIKANNVHSLFKIIKEGQGA